MAEPQPPTVQEGIDLEDPPAPTGADARKEAAALSSLDARGEDDETAQSSTVKNIDQQALVNAISRLELSTGKSLDSQGGEEQKKREAERKKERERRAKVKVDAADVGLLVEELELSKIKATDLLKAHEGDAIKAMTSFVTPVVA